MSWGEWAARAITVPWRAHGRTYAGWDCWGLVVCAYRDVLGVELPGYEAAYSSPDDARAIHCLFSAGRQTRWEECIPAPGVVAAIQRRRRCIHSGLVITGADILHVERNVGTVLEPAESLNVEGYWRLCS